MRLQHGVDDCVGPYVHAFDVRTLINCNEDDVLQPTDAVVTTTIRLRFDGRSTAYQSSLG